MAERLIELEGEEMWTPFLEQANQLFIEEKVARHQNDPTKLAEVCVRIVQLSFDNKEFKRLNEFVLTLTK